MQFQGPVTILVPTNEAFAALGNETLASLVDQGGYLETVMANHFATALIPKIAMTNGQTIDSYGALNWSIAVLNEADVSVNGANLVQTDLLTNNAIVHVIDKVLLMDLFQIVYQSDSYTTFAMLADRVSLQLLMDDVGDNVTLFVPTNDAFDALGNVTLQALLQNDTSIMRLLSNHLVAGRLPTWNITEGASIPTLGDDGLELVFTMTSVAGQDILVNGEARMWYVDYWASNGVFHGIDQVLFVNDLNLSIGTSAPSWVPWTAATWSPATVSSMAPAPALASTLVGGDETMTPTMASIVLVYDNTSPAPNPAGTSDAFGTPSTLAPTFATATAALPNANTMSDGANPLNESTSVGSMYSTPVDTPIVIMRNVMSTTVVDYPLNGSVRIDSNQSITYLPNSGFVGQDRMVFEICDAGSLNDAIIVKQADGSSPCLFQEVVIVVHVATNQAATGSAANGKASGTVESGSNSTTERAVSSSVQFSNAKSLWMLMLSFGVIFY